MAWCQFDAKLFLESMLNKKTFTGSDVSGPFKIYFKTGNFTEPNRPTASDIASTCLKCCYQQKSSSLLHVTKFRAWYGEILQFFWNFPLFSYLTVFSVECANICESTHPLNCLIFSPVNMPELGRIWVDAASIGPDTHVYRITLGEYIILFSGIFPL